MPTILGANQLDTGYEIDNGLVFNGANQWMTHTRGTATDEKLFTFSAWIKLGQAGILENGAIFGAGDDGNGYVGDAFMVQTNGLTIAPNGSQKIGEITSKIDTFINV